MNKSIQNRIMILYFIVIILLIGLVSEELMELKEIFFDLLIFGFVLFDIFTGSESVALKALREKDKLMIVFAGPWIAILGYSVIIQLVEHLTRDYLVHSLTLSVRMMEYIFFFYIALKRIGDMIIDLFFVILILDYCPLVIKYFWEYGLAEGLLLILNGEAAFLHVDIEVHKLTYIFGMFCIYYLYRYIFGDKKKRFLFLFLASGVCMLLGVKRIVLADVVLVVSLVILLYILRKYCSDKFVNRLVLGCAIGVIIASIGYVAIIQNGYFAKLMKAFHISTMSRLTFWDYVSDRYSMTIDYLGHGISFSHRVMVNEYKNIPRIADDKPWKLHNDILGIYMGLGFIGSTLYWIWFFVVRTVIVKKDSIDGFYFAILISLFYYISFMVSNGGLSPFNNGVVVLLILKIVNDFQNSKTILSNNLKG